MDLSPGVALGSRRTLDALEAIAPDVTSPRFVCVRAEAASDFMFGDADLLASVLAARAAKVGDVDSVIVFLEGMYCSFVRGSAVQGKQDWQ